MELKLKDVKLKPQIHRVTVSRGILYTVAYEIKEGNAEDILDIVIDIRDIADGIIKLLKGE